MNLILGVLLNCLIILASSLNHILHFKCELGSKTPSTNYIQSLWKILLLTDYKFEQLLQKKVNGYDMGLFLP